jgi:FtsP/CotA-like multicopper oxidase with cupredoxin domain
MTNIYPRRRRKLPWILGIGGAVLIASGGAAAVAWVTSPVDTIGSVRFEQPLTIPPLADSKIDQDGRRVFELTAQSGTTETLPGQESSSWGFNGPHLGPTLRAKRGEQVVVNVHNELDEATTVHWHGMHLPAEMDGGPHQMVDAGKQWSPTWKVDQPAASLWYHPHVHGETREHVGRGLAGMFILDDPDEPAQQQLPHDYGVDDIPVIVQDHSIRASGELRPGSNFGDTLLVNGDYGPFLDVTTEAVRLRLLNASSARVYNFGFSDDRDFAVVGGDGGLLPAPVERDRLTLSPGERAEIVVELQPGEDVVLRSFEADLGGGLTDRFSGGADRFDVLELRAADDLDATGSVPRTLASAPDLVRSADTTEPDRIFELQGNKINGKSMDMNRVYEVVEVDTTEIWEVKNTDGEFHNFHVHDVQFQVLDIDGQPPAAELAGWKDTVLLKPGSKARLAMRFSDYTDPDHPYMLHCHRLRHEDQGMMAQFVVVEPGQAAGTPPSHSNADARPSHNDH